jgi:hypothetical protein
MAFSTSVSEDRLRLAELATARLERQSRRIIQHDPTIPISKVTAPKTTRTKVIKQPLPREYAESSDGDGVSTTGVSLKVSPFDVHAKVFRPFSRESSHSRSHEPPIQDSTLLSTDQGDFQLVTSRKTKPSSKSAVGLNAQEAKADEKPSAIVAPFNKRDLNEVFGNDLPPIAFFLSTVGHGNGHVEFAIHPNGDVSAQQWSDDAYQWYNIGQFSNVRKRTEGLLASHRLHGENELHSLQQHTLSYFRAVAKQHEASTLKRPFGMAELQDAMPKIPTEPVVRGVVTATSSVAELHPKFNPRTLLAEQKQQTHHTPPAREQHPGVQAGRQIESKQILKRVPSAQVYGNMALPYDTSASATENNVTRMATSYDQTPIGPTAFNNLTFALISTGAERTPAANSLRFSSPNEVTGGLHGVNLPGHYSSPFQPKNFYPTPASQLYSPPVPTLDYLTYLQQAQPHTVSAAQAQRNFTKACLDRIFDAATSRNSNASVGTRTVLHDPFQNLPAKTVPVTPKVPAVAMAPPRSEPKQEATVLSSTPIGQSQSTSSNQTSSCTSVDELEFDPRDSEPDYTPGPRTMETIDINTPYMTTEDLAYYSRPSPQNFHGPFFMGSPDVPGEYKSKSHEQELHDWFSSGLKTIERQDEHFKYIKAAHGQTSAVSQPRLRIGAIGTRSASDEKREAEPFNETTTRLFLSVHERLAQYTQGPMEQRRGYLARFCDPPEWCIDKSVNGNNSFFGDDWGQPPERISRDSRYRPLPFESMFGGYEDLHPSKARPRFGSGAKY